MRILDKLFQCSRDLSRCVIFIICILSTNAPLASNTIRTTAPELYRQDLIELAEVIKSEHPRPFQYIDKDRFDQLVADHVDAITAETDKKAFLWAFTEILSSIECGHSNMGYFNQQNQIITPLERFPLDVRIFDKRLFVIDPLVNSDVVSIGDEIVSINGIAVSELINTSFKHISSEGVALNYKKHAFNLYATSYLTYALNFPSAYQVTLAKANQAIVLSPLNSFQFKPIIHPQDACQDKLCFRSIEDSSIGIMTIRSFAYYGSRGQDFVDFINSSFSNIDSKNLESLIIDLRGHDGGSGIAAAHLLRSLAKKPFKYFSDESDLRGNSGLFELQQPYKPTRELNVYLLVNGDTVSSAGHFASIFKENKMGVIIGESMGGNKSVNDGAKWRKSSNHGVEYKVARMRFDAHAPSQSILQPVTPDIEINDTLDDVLSGQDSVLEFAIRQASKQNDQIK